jgi:hypothetical protein
MNNTLIDIMARQTAVKTPRRAVLGLLALAASGVVGQRIDSASARLSSHPTWQLYDDMTNVTGDRGKDQDSDDK